MKFLVLLFDEGGVQPWEEMLSQEQDAAMAAHSAFGAACADADGVQIITGEALGDAGTVTTVRHDAGARVVTAGPYAEVVEQLGGLYIVQAPDLDTLLELTRELPAYNLQITPINEPG